MPVQMQVVITLRKNVENQQQAQNLANTVKDRLSDNPDIIVTAHTTTHFEAEAPT